MKLNTNKVILKNVSNQTADEPIVFLFSFSILWKSMGSNCLVSDIIQIKSCVQQKK